MSLEPHVAGEVRGDGVSVQSIERESGLLFCNGYGRVSAAMCVKEEDPEMDRDVREIRAHEA